MSLCPVSDLWAVSWEPGAMPRILPVIALHEGLDEYGEPDVNPVVLAEGLLFITREMDVYASYDEAEMAADGIRRQMQP